MLLTYADISKNITCVGEYASGSSGTDEDRNIYVFGQQYLNTGDSAITIQFIGSVEY